MSGNDSSTKLLIHCDGADTSTTFTDVSVGGGGHTVTTSPDASVDTAQSKFGGASALLTAVFDFLYLDGSSDFAFGTGDFVIDLWFRVPNASGTEILCDFTADHEASGALLAFLNGANIIFYSAGTRIDSGAVVSADTWYHWALVRSSGTTRMFLDGAQVGSDFTDSRNYTVDADNPTFGASSDHLGEFMLDGWLDEIRISKGTDRGWSGGFTPPTAEYSVDVAGQPTSKRHGGVPHMALPGRRNVW